MNSTDFFIFFIFFKFSEELPRVGHARLNRLYIRYTGGTLVVLKDIYVPKLSHSLEFPYRVKIELFSREGQIFPEGRNLIFFPENVKYRKLLCDKLLFSCKLSKPDPSPILALFQRGRPLLQGVESPVNFYPELNYRNLKIVILNYSLSNSSDIYCNPDRTKS